MSHGYEEAPKSFEFAWRAFVQRLSLAAVEIIMPSDGRLSSFNIRQGLASRTFLGHVQYGRQLGSPSPSCSDSTDPNLVSRAATCCALTAKRMYRATSVVANRYLHFPSPGRDVGGWASSGTRIKGRVADCWCYGLPNRCA